MTTLFYVMAWLSIANSVAASLNGFADYYETGGINQKAHEASIRMLLSMICAALFFMVAK